MTKKINYYNIDRIMKENADINWILGERSNGKSYQVKLKIMFDEYFESFKKNQDNPDRFMLVRRREDEITITLCQAYFDDFKNYISKMTDDKYDHIKVSTNKIYLAKGYGKNEILGDYIGYRLALINEQDLAGTSYLDVKNIIFEEVISRSTYLGLKEPDKLMNLYSTIDRKRGIVKLWLLGNTISKVCPYFNAWGLDKYLYKMQPGDIITYLTDSGYDDKVKIAIEYTGSSGTSSHTIGKSSAMMSDGSWQVDEQPKLDRSIKDYKYLNFEIFFKYKTFIFKARLYKGNDMFFFVSPAKKISKNSILFTDEILDRPLTFINPYNITINNNYLNNVKNIINKCFITSKIFYCNDVVGTDFKQVLPFKIKEI